MVQIRKIEREKDSWGEGKKCAIESILYETSTQEPVSGRTPKIEEIIISSQEEFLRVTRELQEANTNSAIMADKFGNPFFTTKRLILL